MKNMGVDKIAHFGVGGIIASVVSIIITLATDGYGWAVTLYPLLSHLVVFVLSYIKERWMDDKFEWDDIWAAMVGSATIHAAFAAGYLLNLIFN